MCLVKLHNKELRRAEEDITVYKVLLVDKTGALYTPYKWAKAAVGSKITSIAPVEDAEDRCIVTRQGVHAYMKYEDARHLVSGPPAPSFGAMPPVIHKAVIQKGEGYYVGDFGSQVAAGSIIIGERVITDEDVPEEA